MAACNSDDDTMSNGTSRKLFLYKKKMFAPIFLNLLLLQVLGQYLPALLNLS